MEEEEEEDGSGWMSVGVGVVGLGVDESNLLTGELGELQWRLEMFSPY